MSNEIDFVIRILVRVIFIHFVVTLIVLVLRDNKKLWVLLAFFSAVFTVLTSLIEEWSYAIASAIVFGIILLIIAGYIRSSTTDEEEEDEGRFIPPEERRKYQNKDRE